MLYNTIIIEDVEFLDKLEKLIKTGYAKEGMLCNKSLEELIAPNITK